MLATVPVSVIDAALLVKEARPAVEPSASAPPATDKVTVSLPAPTSTSEIVIALPVPELNVRVASSFTPCVPGTELTGASLTAVTLMVRVLGDWSRSTPPLAVPPLSRTWNVKLASGDPLAFNAGVNTRWPAAMSVAKTKSPAFTVTPLLVNGPVPAPGTVVIFTACREFGAELSEGSLNPKSATPNV